MRARKLIKRTRALLLLTAALMLYGIYHYADLNTLPPASSVAAPSTQLKVRGPRAPALVDAPRQTDASEVRESADHVMSGLASPASRGASARIELSTDEVVGVGQPYELVVRMDPPRHIGRMAFTVSVDPQMLEILSVRAGGPSSVDASSNFILEEGPATGQTTITMDLSNAIPENNDGAIASVQFEVLASGTASVVISDLAMSDVSGRTIPYAASSLTAQAEVSSGSH